MQLAMLIIIGLLSLAAAAAEAAEPPASSLPTGPELERAGAIVGDIYIEAQNIFDLSDPRENKALYRAANAIHIKTQERVIRQQLLFRSGDRYSERLLQETERILRSARYLYDASVRPIAWRDGRVDIAVTTRDVWTLNPGISFGRRGGANSYGFEIEERNLLGTGTALSLSHKSSVDRDTNEIEYQDPHIAGTWVSLRARYANNSDGSAHGFALDRPFYALDTRWAAGVAAGEDERIDSLYDRGKIVDAFRMQQRGAGASWGWSGGLQNGWARRWRVGWIFDDRQFEAAPGWSGALVPENRKLVYPWISYEMVQDDYGKYINHDQIGRTEDFHLGTRWSALLGWSDTAFGADRKALIFGTAVARGMAPSNKTTLLLSGSFGGRLESGGLENALFDASARYYVQQSSRRLFFASVQATIGSNLDLDQQVLLGGDNGLRGYPLRYQGGTARALATVEQRYFTNWYPFRLFRIGGAAFIDVGRTWGDTPVNTPSLGLLKDIGVGLRLASTRSGLGNVIHVDLAIPLDGDPAIDKVQLVIETKARF
ncbi:BamA/TamA family outer membrane protein [Steroidobacter cummioxidans]|uniref:BamA/TamA family outer membrane protein n=1 Tax=Steroidobacter cummioxidans TaxID=1803913 RepID=UPI000E30FB8A|nr:BamA/TamA family outer membrane protein [Steroidobacter cummioxidans]